MKKYILLSLCYLLLFQGASYCETNNTSAEFQRNSKFLHIGMITLGKSRISDVENSLGAGRIAIGCHAESARLWRIPGGTFLIDGDIESMKGKYLTSIINTVGWFPREKDENKHHYLMLKSNIAINYPGVTLGTGEGKVIRFFGNKYTYTTAYSKSHCFFWKFPVSKRDTLYVYAHFKKRKLDLLSVVM